MSTPSTINILASNCFASDATGALMASGTLTVKAVDANDNVIPFTANGLVVGKSGVTRQITSGSMVGSLVLQNPAVGSPTGFGYSFEITDLSTYQTTEFKSVQVTPDGSGNFNLANLSAATYSTALPVVYSTGPAGPAPSGTGVVSVVSGVAGLLSIGTGLTLSGNTLSSTGGGAVSSVNGQTGAVVLTASTVGADASGAAAAAQAAAIAASDPSGAAATVQAASLQKANNLSDLTSASTARTNLGLGTAAVAAAPASAIVGVSDVQTLTNKTIDGVTPTIMGYLDATSSIQTQLNSKMSATATSNSTLTTLSALSLPGSQVTGTVPSATTAVSATTATSAGNITATSNSTLTTLSALSLPASQVTGLGTAATTAASAYDAAGAAATAQTNATAAFTGDVTKSAGSFATTVTKLNGTSLAGLSTGLLKITTGTGIPSTAVAGTDYALPNANTTGQAGTVATISGLIAAGTNVTVTGSGTTASPFTIAASGSGGMVYPGAGIAVSTGTAWSTSVTAPASAIVGISDTQTLTNKTVNGVAPATFAYLDATSSIQTQLNSKMSATATSNSTLTTLSALSLPGSQVTGTVPSATTATSAANITATSNSTLTTLSALSLPATQVTGLGTAATTAASAYDVAGAATAAQAAAIAASAQRSNNLSDLASAAISRGNLGLGWDAVKDSSFFNVLDHGALADAKTSTCSISSGSTTLTDSSAPFVSTDTGKLFVVNAAGNGSQGTTAFGQNITISAIASVSSTTQITFTNNALNTVNLANGSQVTILAANSTGGFASLASNVFYYVGSVTFVSGSTYTALLYTSPALTGNVTYPGSTGTGTMSFGTVQLVATGTYVSATQMTLSVAAGTAVSGGAYTYGTNLATAFAACHALAVTAGGGTIFIPQGTYVANGTASSPNTVAASSANIALPVTASNITVRGSGMSSTIIKCGSWYQGGVCAFAGSSTLTNIQIRDLSVTFANAAGTRVGVDYASITVGLLAIGSGSISRSIIDNVETFNDVGGQTITGNCFYCCIRSGWSHDGHANRFSFSASSGNGPQHCTIMDCYAYNAGDSLFCCDMVTGSTPLDLLFSGIHGENGGNAGIEIIGGTGVKLTNFIFRKMFGAGVKIGSEVGYAALLDVQVLNGQIFGSGTGTRQYGNPVSANVGGVVIEAPGTNSITGVQISGIQIDADGSNLTVGSYIGIKTGPVGTITNLQFDDVQGLGGCNGTIGTGQSTCGSTACVDLEAGKNIRLTNSYFYGAYGEGVYVASAVTGNLLLANLMVDTPNTSAAATKYAYDIQGGVSIAYDRLQLNNPATLSGVLNYAPAPATVIANTFSAAGGFTAASLAGQYGTGTGASSSNTWQVPVGTVTVSTTNNTISATAGSICYLNAKRRDCFFSVTLGVVPTGVSQCLLLLGYDGADNPLTVNLYSLAIGINTTTLAAPPTYTPAVADVITAGLQGNRLSVWLTRSGTKTLLVDCFVPVIPATSGTYFGIDFITTTATIAAANLAY